MMLFRINPMLFAFLAFACTPRQFNNNETSGIAAVQGSGSESGGSLPNVFVSGAEDQTIFPDLTPYCELKGGIDLSYNTAVGRAPIWGYMHTITPVKGCGTSTLSLEGQFFDVTSESGACEGNAILTQTNGKMQVTWKDIKSYFPEGKSCAQARTKSYTLELTLKNIADLKTPYLSWYEYNLVYKGSSFGLKVVAENGIPGLEGGGLGDPKTLTYKRDSILQAYSCSRGGAGFPEGEICMKINSKGETWGTVLESSEPLPRMYSQKTARLKRADVKLVKIK